MIELIGMISKDFPELYIMFQIMFLVMGILLFNLIREIIKNCSPIFYRRLLWPFYSKQFIEKDNIEKEKNAIIYADVWYKKLERMPNSGNKCFRIDSNVFVAFKWKDRKLEHVYVSGIDETKTLQNIKIT